MGHAATISERDQSLIPNALQSVWASLAHKADPQSLQGYFVTRLPEAISAKTDTPTIGQTYWSSLCRSGGERQVLVIFVEWLEREGAHQQAATMASAWASKFPEDQLALVAQSRLYIRLGRLNDAIERAIAAIKADPDTAIGFAALGDALLAAARCDDAVGAYAHCLSLAPNNLSAQINLASALLQLRRYTEARTVLDDVLHHAPNDLDGLANLAALHLATGETGQSLTLAMSILAAAPDHQSALVNAASAHVEQDHPLAALALTERHGRNAANPKLSQIQSEAYLKIGRPDLALKSLGDWKNYDDASACALQSALMHAPSTRSGDLIRVAGPAAVARATGQERDPKQKQRGPLRLGIHSADFRSHAMGYFLPTLLQAARDQHAEIYCYSGVLREDEITRECRQATTAWRDIGEISDRDAITQIEADRLDILIDCIGLTRGNRLGIMRNRPAPVLAHWILGWGAPTGQTAFDYLLADRYLIPGADWTGGERLFHLPWSVAPFRPDPRWPMPSSAPTKTTQTYGCFAQPGRITPSTLELWSALLLRDRHSTLFLWHPNYAEPETKQYWTERLALYGLEGRVTLSDPGTVSMAEAYAGVSLILDTYPVSGATTSLIALWMGVPLVTLAGPAPWQRFGLEILTACGLQDWIAESAESYVNIALDVAKNPLLSGVSLRERLAASPLLDAPARATDFLSACSSMIASAG